MKDPRDVIIRPVVSEKSYTLLEDNVYTFEVHPSSSKPEIKDAVESIFDVDVLKVNTLIRKGKRKKNRRTNTWGQRAHHASVQSSPSPRATRSNCSRSDHGYSSS